jgi:flagellar hook-length control protein FliK
MVATQAKVHAQAALPQLPGQDEATAKDAATAKGAAAAKPPAAGDTTAAPAALPDPNTAAAPPALPGPTGTDNAPPAAPQPNAQGDNQTNFEPMLNLAAGAANGAATGDSAGTSGTQPATSAAKTATSEVPSLGVVAAGAPASQAAAAAPSTPTAVAVPISALPVAIAARAKAGSNQFDIRLDPPELGRIDVRLDVGANGQVTSHVTADRPETLTLLQNQQPQLERALEQAGLKTADNGMQFSLRDQSFTGQNSNGGNAQTSLPQLVIHDPELASIETRQIYARVSLGGGVDIRV